VLVVTKVSTEKLLLHFRL